MGLESGEVVAEESDSTFATGEPVNVAARLQQAAAPGEILLGPGVHRLVAVADRVRGGRAGRRARPRAGRSRRGGCSAWTEEAGRVLQRLGAVRGTRGRSRAAAEHVRARAARPPGAARHDLRLPGRREEPAGARVRRRARRDDDPRRPLSAVRRGDHVLAARRDGEGGGRNRRRRPDRRGAREAARVLRRRRRRRLARSRLGRPRRRHGRPQRAGDRLGRARVGDRARRRAAAGARVRGHPLGRGAAARPDRAPGGARARRAGARPLVSRGRSSSTSARTGAAAACARSRSSSSRCRRGERELVDALLDERLDRRAAARGAGEDRRATRSSSRRRCACSRSRDRRAPMAGSRTRSRRSSPPASTGCPCGSKALLRRAAVIGRVFWAGALESCDARRRGRRGPRRARRARVRDAGAALDDLRRDAYRFKHVLIREVAYGGLAKGQRAELHERFAEWLATRGGRARRDPRVPPRPRGALCAELDGTARELASRRPRRCSSPASARSRATPLASARKLLLQAAGARADARAPVPRRRGRLAHGRSPGGLDRDGADPCARPRRPATAARRARADGAGARDPLPRRRPTARARELGQRAFEAVAGDDDIGRTRRSTCSARSRGGGRPAAQPNGTREKLAIAERLERVDLQSTVLAELARIHRERMDGEPIEPLVERSLALAELSGSLLARAGPAGAGRAARHRGDLDGAEETSPPRMRSSRRPEPPSHREDAQLARRRRLLESVATGAPSGSCARRSGSSSRWATAARSSRPSASSPRCCSSWTASTRRSGIAPGARDGRPRT